MLMISLGIAGKKRGEGRDELSSGNPAWGRAQASYSTYRVLITRAPRGVLAAVLTRSLKNTLRIVLLL